MPSDPHLVLWYHALSSPRGIRLTSTDRRLTIQRLYKARAERDDPAISDLSIVLSPANPDDFYIVKRDPNDPPREP